MAGPVRRRKDKARARPDPELVRRALAGEDVVGKIVMPPPGLDKVRRALAVGVTNFRRENWEEVLRRERVGGYKPVRVW